MVAGIEKTDGMVFFGEAPWHRMGKIADKEDIYDWSKFAEKANLLWGIRKVPLCTTEYAQAIIDKGDKEVIQPNTESFAVVREDTNSVLGVVGSSYTPLSNRDSFSFFQDWLDEKLVELNTAGSLFSGKKVWVLAKISENNIADVIPGDSIERYVLLSNSHDGTSAVRLGFSNIRVVCANTMSAAHNSAESKLIRSVHSSRLKKNLEDIKQIMDLAHQEFQATLEKYQFLAKKSINSEDLKKYVKILLDLDKKEEKDISTRSKNLMNKVFNLMEDSTQKVEGMSGTYWAAYNSFNHYLVHEYGRNYESRLNNLWFGLGKSKNDKALQLALQMAT